MQSVATEDIITECKDATTREAIVASTNMQLRIPVAQILNSPTADREGYINWDRTYKCLRNGVVETDYPEELTWQLLIGAEA